MKQLVCEMCGSTDLVKEGGVFICQSCGCKYSVEEARKMMVEGVVVVDKSGDAVRFLDLAREAKKAGNNKKAEDYASQALEIDTKSLEAWYIQGCAIGWQTSIAKDRYQEAFSCFKKMLDIISELPIVEVTSETFELIKQLKDQIVEITGALCKLYCDPFENQPSVVNKNYITETLKQIILVNAVMLDTIGKKATELLEKVQAAANDDGIVLTEKDIQSLIDKIPVSIGKIYYDASRQINASQVKSFTNWNTKWEKIRIFDYYGIGNHNDDAERSAFNNCSVAYENMQDVLNSAIAFMSMKEVAVYEKSTNDAIRLLNGLSGESISTVSADEQIVTFYKNKIFIGETDLKMRTNRRYHNQYSSDKVTNDGFSYNETAKAEKQRNIDHWKCLRDEHDPAKRAAALKERREQQYWAMHPSANYEVLEARRVAKSIQVSITGLEKERSSLGLFKGKEKAALAEQIAAKEGELKKAKQAVSAAESKKVTKCTAWMRILEDNAEIISEASIEETTIRDFVEEDGSVIGVVTLSHGVETRVLFSDLKDSGKTQSTP